MNLVRRACCSTLRALDNFAGHLSSILSLSISSGSVELATNRPRSIINNSGYRDPDIHLKSLDIASPYIGSTSGSDNDFNIDRFKMSIRGDGSLLDEGLIEDFTSETFSAAESQNAKLLYDVS